MAKKQLTVNGKRVTIDIDDPDMPLLYALRDNRALHGPRFGCGLAQCGSCTVHVDGKAVRSCVTPVSSITDKQKVGVSLDGGCRVGLFTQKMSAIVEHAGPTRT